MDDIQRGYIEDMVSSVPITPNPSKQILSLATKLSDLSSCAERELRILLEPYMLLPSPPLQEKVPETLEVYPEYFAFLRSELLKIGEAIELIRYMVSQAGL